MSRAFGGAPIHLHAADARWVMRPDPAIESWEGDELDLGPGLTLLRREPGVRRGPRTGRRRWGAAAPILPDL